MILAIGAMLIGMIGFNTVEFVDCWYEDECHVTKMGSCGWHQGWFVKEK